MYQMHVVPRTPSVTPLIDPTLFQEAEESGFKFLLPDSEGLPDNLRNRIKSGSEMLKLLADASKLLGDAAGMEDDWDAGKISSSHQAVFGITVDANKTLGRAIFKALAESKVL